MRKKWTYKLIQAEGEWVGQEVVQRGMQWMPQWFLARHLPLIFTLCLDEFLHRILSQDSAHGSDPTKRSISISQKHINQSLGWTIRNIYPRTHWPSHWKSSHSFGCFFILVGRLSTYLDGAPQESDGNKFQELQNKPLNYISHKPYNKTIIH